MRTKLFLWGCLYLVFVIYGSLVPLEIKVITMEEAISRYYLIPYLDLNMFSRADWIANAILYIPLAFMLAGGLCPRKNIVLSFFVTCIVVVACTGIAHFVEFTQLFFPKRTVSQNDLIAETIGSCIGGVVWLVFGSKFVSMVRNINLGNFEFLKQSLNFYLLAYLFLAFFPFDFVLSYDELVNKFNDNSQGQNECTNNLLRCVVSSVSEIVITIPIGVQIALFVKYPPHRIVSAILTGVIIGTCIEVIQLFLVTGVFSFLSVIYKTFGLYLGVLIYSKSDEIKNFSNINIAKLLLFLLAPYVMTVAGINGWFTQEWLTFSEGISTFSNIQFLPFSYHYNVTEMMAMMSLLATSGMYGVIGFCYAMLPNKNNKWIAGLYAGLFCLLIESGKLFMVVKHPDPTNIMIAFFASMLGCWYLLNIKKWFTEHHLRDK